MTMGFRPAPGGAAISLDPDEAAVLRSMAAMLLGLIEEPRADDEFARIVGIGSETEPPKDPVLARLLPDAYTGDAEAAGEFRRYTEDDLAWIGIVTCLRDAGLGIDDLRRFTALLESENGHADRVAFLGQIRSELQERLRSTRAALSVLDDKIAYYGRNA